MDRKYIAEFLGTFSLVFTGCGAIIVNDVFNGVVGHIGICIVFVCYYYFIMVIIRF